jgi:hypothetical protein
MDKGVDDGRLSFARDNEDMAVILPKVLGDRVNPLKLTA